MLKGYRMLDMIKLWGSSSWVLINHVLKSSSPRTHAWKSAPGNWRQNSSEHRAWSLMYHNVKSWWNSGGVTVLWARLDDGEVLKPYRCLYKHSAESHDTVCRTDLLFSPFSFLSVFVSGFCLFLSVSLRPSEKYILSSDGRKKGMAITGTSLPVRVYNWIKWFASGKNSSKEIFLAHRELI